MIFKKFFLSSATAAVTMIMAGALCLSGCGGSKQESGNVETVVKEEHVAETTVEPIEPSEQPDASVLSLKDAYADRFSVGVAINSWQLADPDILEAVTKDYSSITMENEMKPDSAIDHNASIESKDRMPVINKEKLDEIMTMAENSGLKMRGHTLIWQNQTPNWLFHKDFDESKDYANRDTMLKRMESYIRQMITYAQEEHPGTVYAWDVVNEAVSDGEDFLKPESQWYITIGEDYVEKAFEFARKYANDDVKLFYNDYNCIDAKKSKKIYELISNLHEKGIIDGLGMQSHYDVKYYAPASLETSLYKYAQIEGLEIQLTEMDLHYNDNSEESMQDQAEKYHEIFKILVDLDKNGYADITNVTFWGLNDSNTWLTGFKGEKSYPLLYDDDNNAKPCYYSVIDAANE